MTPAIQELIRRNEQLCDRFQQATLDEPDVATALATTAEQITLVNLPMRTGAAQHSGLRRYLTEDVLPHRPADLRRRRVSRTADRFRVVDELVVGFTHDRELPWLGLLARVEPARRRCSACIDTPFSRASRGCWLVVTGGNRGAPARRSAVLSPCAAKMTCVNTRPGWTHGEENDVMALPTLTPEQRADALKKAAAARTARKELRDAIARGDESIPAVLDRAKTDQVVGKTKVADLLKSLPGYGPAKVSALLERTGIDASRRAAGLGERQRQALIDALK